MRTRFWTVMWILGATLVAAASTTLVSEATSAQQSSSPAAASTTPAATTDPTYIIGPQDVLDISVWQNNDLTRSVPVRPDGKISLPLLNDVQAAGLTPDQLKTNITQGLSQYIKGLPNVTVIVTQINSQRFYVNGEVNHPGAFPLLPQTTMLQALSSAGGFTQFANTKRIYLLRMVGGKPVTFPFNYKDVIHGKNTQQNILVESGDTIIVP